jgi:hypothetical protein
MVLSFLEEPTERNGPPLPSTSTGLLAIKFSHEMMKRNSKLEARTTARERKG